jgi:hypothetical protein
MYVRSVDAAGLKEAKGCADTEVGEDGEGFDVLEIVLVRAIQTRSLLELTAALVAPPFAPGAGSAPLKLKTVSFLSVSPVNRVCP